MNIVEGHVYAVIGYSPATSSARGVHPVQPVGTQRQPPTPPPGPRPRCTARDSSRRTSSQLSADLHLRDGGRSRGAPREPDRIPPRRRRSAFRRRGRRPGRRRGRLALDVSTPLERVDDADELAPDRGDHRQAQGRVGADPGGSSCRRALLQVPGLPRRALPPPLNDLRRKHELSRSQVRPEAPGVDRAAGRLGEARRNRGFRRAAPCSRR